jgi:hypothetical protein
MTSSRSHFLTGIAFAALSATVVAQSCQLSPVVDAEAKIEAQSSDIMISPEFAQVPAASGSMKLENPTALLRHYGYPADSPLVPADNDKQRNEHQVEASKTEPGEMAVGNRGRFPLFFGWE